MFRKIALAALAALTLGSATISTTSSVEARPLYLHGGGWHGGGWHGGGWGRGGRWGGGGGWGWGAAGLITGLAAAPLLYGGGYGGYGYDDGYYDEGPACGWRRVEIRTPYGWRLARQRVCY